VTARAEGTSSLVRFVRSGSGRGGSLVVASILLGVMGVLAPEPLIQMGLLAAATTLFLLGIALSLVIRRDRAAQDRTLQAVAGFIEKDSAPSYVCTADGEVLSAMPPRARATRPVAVRRWPEPCARPLQIRAVSCFG